MFLMAPTALMVPGALMGPMPLMALMGIVATLTSMVPVKTTAQMGPLTPTIPRYWLYGSDILDGGYSFVRSGGTNGSRRYWF